MGNLHKNAALTIAQRKLLRDLYLEGHSISALGRRFGVNRKCAQRWAKRDDPHDRKSGPNHPKRLVTEEYRQAVIVHRKANPDHGAATIAHYLKSRFVFANRGTIQQILTHYGLSQRAPKKSHPKKN